MRSMSHQILVSFALNFLRVPSFAVKGERRRRSKIHVPPVVLGSTRRAVHLAALKLTTTHFNVSDGDSVSKD